MTSKKSSHNLFNAMFWQSVKKTCFFPIAAFIILIVFSISEANSTQGYLPSTKDVYGIFWNDLSYFIGAAALASFIVAGIINALSLFSFVTSKKQGNVIFSLGMTRSQIFVSKYLGGTIPMAVSVILAGIIELINQSSLGYGIHKPVVLYMILTVLTYIGLYTLIFTLVAVVFANSGNFVEGLIFSGILSIIPMVIGIGEKHLIDSFTLGGSSETLVHKWHWSDIYTAYYNFSLSQDSVLVRPNRDSYGSFFGEMSTYVSREFSFYDFSSVITIFALIALVFVIGLFAFKKHKNEIAGSWGRAKGLNEICALSVGAYAFVVAIVAFNQVQHHGNGNLLTYIGSVAAFIVAYLIIKLIFGNKRKKEMVKSLKRIPIYVVASGAIVIVFATGLFGYSSKQPDVSQIKSIDVNSQLQERYQNSRDGLLWFSNISSNLYYYPNEELDQAVTYLSKDEFDALMTVHSQIIKDGRVKNNDNNACGNRFIITYNLKDGTNITRVYTETEIETAKKMIALNDLKSSKDYVTGKMSDYMAAVENNSEQSDNDVAFDSEYYEDEYDMYKNMYKEDIYLFSKDMKKAYNEGTMSNELYDALLKDISSSKSENTFYHSAEDEIGIISFGLNQDYTGSNFDGVEYGNGFAANGYSTDDSTDTILPGKDGLYEASWSIDSNKTIVVTKYMTNTIKYLTDNDLLKYMGEKTTANDIKSIKVATRSELFNEDNSYYVPIFNGCHWLSKDCNSNYAKDIMNSSSLYKFSSVNEITNKTTIQSVLDNSFVYGYMGNDYRIVEITYNDGSMGTMCITPETYKAILG